MQYKYATELQDYSDLASGRVFYSLPGHPAFPVRLASEIFQRCLANREMIYGITTPGTLYDPCCGAAYHLSVLGYLHGKDIRKIIGSDVDEKAIQLAARNLGLLSVAGLDKRIGEITTMIEQYNKDSHRDALKSAQLLRNKIIGFNQEHSLTTKVFRASAIDNRAMLEKLTAGSVDVVFTDVPYGQHSEWRDSASNPIWSMLNALINVLSPSSIVAIVSDKQQKASHQRYQPVEQFQVGKRRVVLFRPAWNRVLSH